MTEYNLGRLNDRRKEYGEFPIEMKTTTYDEPIITNDSLRNKSYKVVGTKGDMYLKKILNKILKEGCLDKYPRPVYKDRYEGAEYNERDNAVYTKEGIKIPLSARDKVVDFKKYVEIQVPAHTLSVNEGCQCTYDLSKGESPMITLRPIATRRSFGEILWIYQKQSNDLVEYDKILGYKDDWKDKGIIHNWWFEWSVLDENGNIALNKKGHPHIGKCYGGTTGPRKMVDTQIISQLVKDELRDGRRIMINLWQIDDFKKPHGLKPCAFCSIFNVRRGWDGIDYLDMTLVQRSSDFCTAGCINQVQYVAFQKMIAASCGLTPGYFTWDPVNVQIYDRHLDQSVELLNRKPFNCKATVELKENLPWKEEHVDNIYVDDIPREKIKTRNKQLDFPLGV